MALSSFQQDIDRREAPRFVTNFAADLAAGSALVPVTIIDISMTGCGVHVDHLDLNLDDLIDSAGTIQLPSIDGVTGVILPLVLRNYKSDVGRSRLGLRFCRLELWQTRKLIGTIHSLAFRPWFDR